ncbi:unnamed protein product [Prunus armeniaca]|uniref:Uncharacterized protein n=1 Tax=Prunus armeniaca TaxID=36596 RepID=A0A6J5U108_PRUAR|nr:unnamed protein product [Prunus armeniaca]
MFEFTDSVLQARPDLMWIQNQMGRDPFQFAIECRQEKIYSLIYRLNKRKRTLIGTFGDNYGNCSLHMTGMLSPLAKLDNISGAALQMQRELQWFKVSNLFWYKRSALSLTKPISNCPRALCAYSNEGLHAINKSIIH